ECEFFVVISTDELDGIDGAPFKGWINVTGRNLLRHDAELREHVPTHAANAELEPLKILDTLDFFPEPAAHLGPRIAHHNSDDVEVGQRLVDDFIAAVEMQPGVLMARIEAKRNAGAEGKSGLLTDVEIDRCLGAFDRAI